jgi:hypothetical protein
MAVSTPTNGSSVGVVHQEFSVGVAPQEFPYGAGRLGLAEEIERCNLLGGTFAILVQVHGPAGHP